MGAMIPRGSRRAFLGAAAAVASGGLLGGCTIEQEAAFREAPPPPILPSPAGYTAADVLATPLADEPELESFLALSSLLTGFAVNELNPVLAAVYLRSLRQREDPAAALPTLYERIGFQTPAPPQTLAAVEATGVFADESLSALADTIINYWYTGIYDTAEGQAVATYVDALAWRAIAYTKPRSICGPYPGFWRERPPVIP